MQAHSHQTDGNFKDAQQSYDMLVSFATTKTSLLIGVLSVPDTGEGQSLCS